MLSTSVGFLMADPVLEEDSGRKAIRKTTAIIYSQYVLFFVSLYKTQWKKWKTNMLNLSEY